MNVFEGYRITSPYGWRNDPFTGKRVFHTGIDLVKAHRAPIPAFVPGEVIYAGMGISGTGFGGYGNVVAIKDRNGKLHCYCHLDAVSVFVGQYVQKGQVVGLQGSTGRSTGSHLHYEVRAKCSPHFGWKSHINPGEYLQEYFAKEDEAMFEELKRQFEQLAAENKRLQQRVETLEKLQSMPEIPEWAREAVDAAVRKGLVANPEGGSYDFYRFITVMHRKGLI